MKEIIGFLMVLAGLAIGLYVGVWLCFVGGIVNVIEAIRAPELSAASVAIGIAKVVFSGVIGWISGLCLAIPGFALINK